MNETMPRKPYLKRILITLGATAAFVLLFVVACRIAGQGIFNGIERSRASGLSAAWGEDDLSAARDLTTWGSTWISRSAALRTRTTSFDNSAAALRRIVNTHGGYFEDLKTESLSGHGRTLVASVNVPASELDVTLRDLKSLGRIERISEASEDSSIKLAATERHTTAAKINLARLQKLQSERKGGLGDVLALHKEIAKVSESVSEAEREHEDLVSTVARALIRLTLLEEYRVPLDANFAGASLYMRNSFLEGLSGILSSLSVFLGVALQVGVPLLFWMALLFFPVRAAWRRFHRATPEPLEAN